MQFYRCCSFSSVTPLTWTRQRCGFQHHRRHRQFFKVKGSALLQKVWPRKASQVGLRSSRTCMMMMACQFPESAKARSYCCLHLFKMLVRSGWCLSRATVLQPGRSCWNIDTVTATIAARCPCSSWRECLKAMLQRPGGACQLCFAAAAVPVSRQLGSSGISHDCSHPPPHVPVLLRQVICVY
jgi:hypothetical protein